MTLIRGGPAGPSTEDEDGYKQFVEDDRAALFRALGGRQGILSGFDHSLTVGQLAHDFTAGDALVEERDAAGALGLARGYFLFNDVATQVVHDVPDAASRNDAVVFAFVDIEDGGIGAEVAQSGPQVVPIKGTPGVSTPHTDSAITTALGRGGWFRFADVIIDNGDTEVDPANVTLAANRSAVEPLAIVRATAGQSIPDATLTTITYAEVVRTEGDIGVDLGAGEVTINVPGVYAVTGVVCVDNAGGRLVAELWVDALRVSREGDASPTNPAGSLSADIDAVGGEVITLRVQQVSGSAQDTRELPYPRLSVRRVG